MLRKWIYPAIGVAAFVVGGLVAREKAIEIAGIVEKSFTDNDSMPS